MSNVSQLAGAALNAMPPDAAEKAITMTELADRDVGVFLESLPLSLLLCDAEGLLVAANAAARALLGLAPGRGDAAPQPLSGAGPVGAALARVCERSAKDPRRASRPVRIPVRGVGSFRVRAQRLPTHHVALAVRRESERAIDFHHTLATLLGLGPLYAHLVARVYQGWSNQAIATAFQIPLGRVKWRLAQVYRRLGVRRRAELAFTVGRVLRRASQDDDELGPTSPSVAAASREVARFTTLGPGLLAELGWYLQYFHTALAAVDNRGQLVWANRQAGRALAARRQASDPLGLAGPSGGGTLVGGDGRPRFVQLRANERTLWVSCWSVRPGLAGAWLSQARAREPDPAQLLVGLGLAGQQVIVAGLIANGRSNAEIAQALGLKEGSVRALSTAIYVKLGVGSRVELIALLADLGLRRARSQWAESCDEY